jgi:hypothetical protein
MRTAALQEVLRNYGLACEALSRNLMTLPAPGPAIPTFLTRDPSLVAGINVLGLTPSCAPVPIIRTGDFTFTPGQP